MTDLPYASQWLDDSDRTAVAAALDSRWLTQGPGVEVFERGLATAVGAPHAVAVSSGTAALHLVYRALGVQAGDVVVTSPLTFAATANAALYCDAEPRFADIDPATGCLSPAALERQLRAGLRPKLVVPVHYAGLPCAMGRLAELARHYHFHLVEDACHALGARYLRAATWGNVGDCALADAAVFSFHPAKHITTGEGGAVVTRSADVADRIRQLRSHGMARTGFQVAEQATGPQGEARPWYHEMQELGFNYRITDLQCALGASQLRRLEAFVSRRRQLVQRYGEALRPLEQTGQVLLPQEAADQRSAWHLYPVRIPRHRDRVHLELMARGIGTQVHYIPVHLHPYYRQRFGTAPGMFPCAEHWFDEVLSLPLFPAMDDTDVDRVAGELKTIVRSSP